MIEDCRGLAWSEDMPKIMFYLNFHMGNDIVAIYMYLILQMVIIELKNVLFYFNNQKTQKYQTINKKNINIYKRVVST